MNFRMIQAERIEENSNDMSRCLFHDNVNINTHKHGHGEMREEQKVDK